MTDEELYAPDEVYDTMMEVQRNPTGAWQAIQDQADTITTLRAQLAEAREWKRYWSGEIGVILAGRADEAERADRAEAALSIANATLAAQIEKEKTK